jgi:hypothetical protein
MRFGGSTEERWAYGGESVTRRSGCGWGGCGEDGTQPHCSTGCDLAVVLPVQGIVGGSQRNGAGSLPQTNGRLPSFPFVCPTLTAAAVLDFNGLASLSPV